MPARLLLPENTRQIIQRLGGNTGRCTFADSMISVSAFLSINTFTKQRLSVCNNRDSHTVFVDSSLSTPVEVKLEIHNMKLNAEVKHIAAIEATTVG